MPPSGRAAAAASSTSSPRAARRSSAARAYDFLRNDSLQRELVLPQPQHRSVNPRPRAAAALQELRLHRRRAAAAKPAESVLLLVGGVAHSTRAPASQTASVVNPAWLTDPIKSELRRSVAARSERRQAAAAVAGAELLHGGRHGAVPEYRRRASTTRARKSIRTDVDLSNRWKLIGRYTHDLSKTVEPGGLFTTIAVPNVSATHTAVPGQVAGRRTARHVRQQAERAEVSVLEQPDPHDRRSEQRQHASADSASASRSCSRERRQPRAVAVGHRPAGHSRRSRLFRIQYLNSTGRRQPDVAARQAHLQDRASSSAFEPKNENANNQTQGSFTFASVTGGRTAFQNFLTGNRDGACGAHLHVHRSADRRHQPPALPPLRDVRAGHVGAYADRHARLRLRYALYPSITDANDLLDTFDPAAYSCAPRRRPAPTPTCSLGDPRHRAIHSTASSSPVRIRRSGAPSTRRTRSTSSRASACRGIRRGTGRRSSAAATASITTSRSSASSSRTPSPTRRSSTRSTLQNASLSNPVGGHRARHDRPAQPDRDQRAVPARRARSSGTSATSGSSTAAASIDVGYVGSHGDDLIQPVDINQPRRRRWWPPAVRQRRRRFRATASRPRSRAPASTCARRPPTATTTGCSRSSVTRAAAPAPTR